MRDQFQSRPVASQRGCRWVRSVSSCAVLICVMVGNFAAVEARCAGGSLYALCNPFNWSKPLRLCSILSQEHYYATWQARKGGGDDGLKGGVVPFSKPVYLDDDNPKAAVAASVKPGKPAKCDQTCTEAQLIPGHISSS